MKIKYIVKKAFFLKMLFANPVPLNIRLQMPLRSVTVDKMAGIFTFCQNTGHFYKTNLATLIAAHSN